MNKAGARDEAAYQLALKLREMAYAQGYEGQELSGVALAAAILEDHRTTRTGANLYRHSHKCGVFDKSEGVTPWSCINE